MVICGIDEAGRGPLAGPVTAAAVILGKGFPLEILNDSKKLTEKRRDAAMELIFERAVAWGIGWASSAEIDEINILQASLLAMRRAYLDMGAEPGLAIIDGLFAPDIPCKAEPRVKADATVPEVMAASILAKTARDRMMLRYSWIYPEWDYEGHKGYPTKAHRERIALYGPSPIQRKSFRVKEP
jgi:ribonuclease HII